MQAHLTDVPPAPEVPAPYVFPPEPVVPGPSYTRAAFSSGRDYIRTKAARMKQ